MRKIAITMLLTGLFSQLALHAHAGNKATADLAWFVNYVATTDPTLDEVFVVLDFFPTIEGDVDVYGPFAELPEITQNHQAYTVSNWLAYNDENGNPVWYIESYTLVYYPPALRSETGYCEIYIHSYYEFPPEPVTKGG